MLNTRVWRVNTSEWESGLLNEAAMVLRNGGTVAFPTETVYGLGADARNDAAVARIFEAKGRPSDNPLIVHIANLEQLGELTLPYGETAKKLMERFWPGPLTLVLPVKPGAVSPRVTAGLDTLAVRMPDHPIALELIASSGCPIAGPSANRSGRPSPTHADHVQGDLDGRIDGIVDGGPAGVGLESTVVEIEGDAVRILRPGGITAEALREVSRHVIYDAESVPGEVLSRKALDEKGGTPRSPGMKYTHYAPKGLMQLVIGDADNVSAYIQGQANTAKSHGERAGILAFAEHGTRYEADDVVIVGSLAHPETAAQGLYAALRTFDERGTQRIWAEACPEEGIGHALMNRLVKAAGHRIVRV
ncbi:L-threonylcarbamoyladenylate synthase [Paenibacillus mendelii]|uniref:Threonylcarbamoyl-AMP synthase n=1 Tax=Paenibacillus mendelii TaxID=206163 RepID=A0ABV6J6B9_9BACL|nr:L-threonylcarbamoyladenylate synthase [Paenibacillus mendelii]MCQ6561939.1 L-threonylcarbamoyladenylate synthase [Paenibacillus mendelii]